MLNRLYSWYGKRVVLGGIAVIVLLFITGITLHIVRGNGPEESAPEAQDAVVTVASVRDIENASSFDVVGTVRAVSEARLQTESGGRITTVNVGIGDRVSGGQIIATLESQSERASLLQAEGAYESALAAAASSDISTENTKEALDSALASAVTTYKSLFISADGVIRADTDLYFSNPRGSNPGFRLEGFGMAPSLSNDRVQIETILTAWSRSTGDVTTGNVEARLSQVENDLLFIEEFVETIANLAARQPTDGTFSDTDKATAQATLQGARNEINGLISTLENTENGIVNARANVEKAELASAQGTVSASSASLKQALGALRAAQANYEKTLVRSPISGLVNALYLRAGEYASPSAPAAIIANNDALEITTAVNADDSTIINIGDTVTVNESVSGTVTRKAPAIDPTTGKIEVKVSIERTEDIQNGDTVTLTFTRNTEVTGTEDDEVIVPISALKITATGNSAFAVDENNTIVAIPVTIGEVRGETVEILEGLTHDTHIVTDVRGLKVGQKVTVGAE